MLLDNLCEMKNQLQNYKHGTQNYFLKNEIEKETLFREERMDFLGLFSNQFPPEKNLFF